MSVEDHEAPITEHIDEMVKRALIVIFVAAAGMVVAFFFSEELINIVWYNFIDVEPTVYIPHGKILTQLKFSAMLGLALAIPV
ncbi:MAG: twin-arginine translocase subunit TatC, partial [Halobacteria archaeon]|nr:twin-arginine translocase subunit TatC [Halobacteria archaeon]